MRTTLSLDVVLAVKERARREKRSMGEKAGATFFYGFLPFPHRRKAVSNALIDQLRDEEAV